ncbi:MAG: hypothetical protein H7X94_14945 [Vallitaleaceae bacterium]|nr:hypothetical protein [Vallitaleaceae bacterium]
MKIKKYLTLSNLLFTGSVLFAIAVLLKTYLDNAKVPEGVCPVDNNRGLLIVAITILLLVTVITSIMDYKKKKVQLKIKEALHNVEPLAEEVGETESEGEENIQESIEKHEKE